MKNHTIDAFKKLWPQRLAAATIETEEELEQFIRTELKDELTHPRVRKTKQQKLDLALERISEAQLTQQERLDLIELYKKIAAQLD